VEQIRIAEHRLTAQPPLALAPTAAFPASMKTLSMLLIAVLCTASQGIAKDAPAAPPSTQAKLEAKNVTPDEAEKLIADKKVTILDVRSPEEFQEGHIKGAVNVNIADDDFEKKVQALDQTKPVLVHCEAGGRSSRALDELQGKVKFPQIYHLKSGFRGWKNAQKPVAK
jgi:rhodanese-related sulfurtransferase